MASLLAQQQVAFDYSLGWSHSVGEVFAEDYAYIHVHTRYGITWMSPPDAALESTMFAELGTPTAPLPLRPRSRSPQPGRDARAARRKRSLRASRPGSPRDVHSDRLESKSVRASEPRQLVCDGGSS